MPSPRFPIPALAGALALAVGACTVAPPTGPSVAALPPTGKDFARFRQEDLACRQHAQQDIGYGSPQQAANRSAVGSAALATALGAVVGGLFGSVTGDFGAGAAIGAGGGLLAGSAVGAGTAQTSAAALQRRYDMIYVQCMHASGNQVPTWGGYPYGPYAYPGYPGYYQGSYVGGPGVSFGVAAGRWW
jgi:hypothetical protein